MGVIGSPFLLSQHLGCQGYTPQKQRVLADSVAILVVLVLVTVAIHWSRRQRIASRFFMPFLPLADRWQVNPGASCPVTLVFIAAFALSFSCSPLCAFFGHLSPFLDLQLCSPSSSTVGRRWCSVSVCAFFFPSVTLTAQWHLGLGQGVYEKHSM